MTINRRARERSFMPASTTDNRLFIAAALLWVGLCSALFGLLVLVRDDVGEDPYVAILGGSFIFNYRVADVYMGFTAVPMRPIPVGSILEVTFTDPADAKPLVVRERIGGTDRQMSVRSPSVRGVQANIDYPVIVRLLDRESENEMWRHEFTIKSGISDNLIPEKPLVIGPAYQRANPM